VFRISALFKALILSKNGSMEELDGWPEIFDFRPFFPLFWTLEVDLRFEIGGLDTTFKCPRPIQVTLSPRKSDYENQ
jgi:hypothetical protein